MPGQTCKTCRWWVLWTEGTLVGDCRRYPPVLDPVLQFREGDMVEERCIRPATTEDDWCGEYKPKREYSGATEWRKASARLSPRANRILQQLGVKSVESFLTVSDAEILAQRSCGKMTLEEIRKLRDHLEEQAGDA